MNEKTLFKHELKLLAEAVIEYQTGPNCDWSKDDNNKKYDLCCAYEDILNKLEYMIENHA